MAIAESRWPLPSRWPATICERSQLLGRRTAELHLALALGHRTEPRFAPGTVYRKASAIVALVDARFGVAHLRVAPATARRKSRRKRKPAAREVLESRTGCWRGSTKSSSSRSTASASAAMATIISGQVIDTWRRFRDHRFRRGAGTFARRTADEALAADRRGRHDPLVALRRVASVVSASQCGDAGKRMRRAESIDDARCAMRPIAGIAGRSRRFWARTATPPDRTISAPRRGDCDRLLGLFVLEKAVYELAYELNNRPDWVEVPLAGLLELLGSAAVRAMRPLATSSNGTRPTHALRDRPESPDIASRAIRKPPTLFDRHRWRVRCCWSSA